MGPLGLAPKQVQTHITHNAEGRTSTRKCVPRYLIYLLFDYDIFVIDFYKMWVFGLYLVMKSTLFF